MNETPTKLGFLSDAIQAIRLGQRRLAREIIIRVIEAEPTNENAFLWLAAIAETREEALSILERVLVMNPSNALVSNALGVQRLNYRFQPADAAPLPLQQPPSIDPLSPDCPVCQTPKSGSSGVCPACGAAYSLQEFQALQLNGGANERRIEEAIKSWQGKLATVKSFDAYLGIGLGYLSLNRSGDALPFLRNARDLKPSDPVLNDACLELEERKLVLTVDDSATVRRLISITLERQGHRVRTAVHGLDGLNKFEEEKPDLVLLDITMPHMDGYELCKALRRSPGAKTLPILMLSGNDGVFDRVRGKMAGATDYLTKPFQSEVLLNALAKFLPASEPANSSHMLTNR